MATAVTLLRAASPGLAGDASRDGGSFQCSRLPPKKKLPRKILCSLKYGCLGVDHQGEAGRTTASPVYSSLTVSPAGEASVVVSSEQKVYDVVLKQAALLRRQLRPTTPTAEPAGREMAEAMPRGGLKEAYGRCGEICEEYAKTFYLGTSLMTEERRRAIWAIYDRPKAKKKLHRSPLDPDEDDDAEAVDGAPLHKFPQTLDRRNSPRADGKSSSTASEEATTRTAGFAARNHHIFLHEIFSQIRRTGSGRGDENSSHPEMPEPREVEREAVKLHGAPPPERSHADTKTRSSSTASSRAPPAGDLPTPTLCTRREAGFPHPPAAGAADGGEGTHASPAGEVERRWTLKKSPLLYTVAERRGSRANSKSVV